MRGDKGVRRACSSARLGWYFVNWSIYAVGTPSLFLNIERFLSSDCCISRECD